MTAASEAKDGLSPLAVCSIIVNACMGMGFLALPYTSLRVGPLVATAITLGLGVVALLTGLWTAVSLSLTAAFLRQGGHPPSQNDGCDLDSEVQARTPLLVEGLVERESAAKEGGMFGLDCSVTYVSMVGLLFGNGGRWATVAMLSLSFAVAMWSYAGLVASSLAAMVPLPLVGGTCDVYADWLEPDCQMRYLAYLAAFAALVVCLSLLRLREQAHFQIAMTVVRMLLVSAILGDCARMHVLGEAPPHPGARGSGHATSESLWEDVNERYDPRRFPTVPEPGHLDLSQVPRHVAMATAALSVHMVIPEAVHDLARKPSTLLPTVAAALALCCLVYCLVGAAVASTFGEWTRPVCTLNWVSYTGGQATVDAAARLLRSVIILVPVVDVSAAYPILALSLATNVLSGAGQKVGEGPRWQLLLACASLPIVGAAFVFDIGKTMGWVGVLLLPLVFLIPPMLLLRAETLCISAYGVERVHGSLYWRWYCDRRVVWAGLIVGVVISLTALSFMLGIAA
mmetsp:Transcript_16814/g.48033  ORF Transcript_16814/g.48033 Transcript_16814/m.48033 type:complete len:513 (+) Transcript_16814:123-1661(+)